MWWWANMTDVDLTGPPKEELGGGGGGGTGPGGGGTWFDTLGHQKPPACAIWSTSVVGPPSKCHGND